MKRRIAGIIGALFLAPTALVAVPTPANAETCFLGVCIGGKVFHGNDTGYDRAIVVYCNFGSDTPHYVAEGTSSKADCGTDTDQIYVRAGTALWCTNGNILAPAQLETKEQGRYKINDLWSKTCTLRLK